MKKYLLVIITFLLSYQISAQVDESKIGAWYMYFFNHQFKNSQFGIQGDVQHRNWNVIGDLEQLLIRTGFTYTPKDTNVLLTLGYANITTGAFGDADETTGENRMYQEVLFPQKLGNRIYLTHRFRYEQRFVEDQDFRTRYRYNLFLNIPINKSALDKGAIYTALYNELFINGQEDIGDGRTVELFDRNRTYLGMGYVLREGQRIQLGWMNQKTDAWGKGQLQFSFHHNF
ncbi:DUF2490 domain-containing protein [Subsaximicrobium wynnwilliamsii]|uniref:DUF2490 domain-containing protein n=1 Tax=Subsaximicrobium wynnwilliamsii TaxID=291179 RepID=A0A5C6ZFR6_9FLAO|nr:DUF2490 domain-containing protein [Subsaximicrobium wynnwilliamsii]TXD82982.1 DUF2490 domain-containing protein [Subsaximicrobium wynnwilliamsii]TXD88704.1 DUF2490 domain-containing protein [Subsaximicrobium wynnwilliamsii]TXE02797.1 DUF2490 domain-containing protein [Subsaximicrobium wynnwilliamsii]